MYISISDKIYAVQCLLILINIGFNAIWAGNNFRTNLPKATYIVVLGIIVNQLISAGTGIAEVTTGFIEGRAYANSKKHSR
jgi:hypothetical protein